MSALVHDRRDAIEIHFEETYGQLCLNCDDETFARLRDLILYEARTDDIVSAREQDIRSIWVGRILEAREDAPSRRLRVGEVISLILAMCISGLIYVVGIVVIVKWILTRIS